MSYPIHPMVVDLSHYDPALAELEATLNRPN
jgi:hypothetical protein